MVQFRTRACTPADWRLINAGESTPWFVAWCCGCGGLLAAVVAGVFAIGVVMYGGTIGGDARGLMLLFAAVAGVLGFGLGWFIIGGARTKRPAEVVEAEVQARVAVEIECLQSDVDAPERALVLVIDETRAACGPGWTPEEDCGESGCAVPSAVGEPTRAMYLRPVRGEGVATEWVLARVSGRVNPAVRVDPAAVAWAAAMARPEVLIAEMPASLRAVCAAAVAGEPVAQARQSED